MKVLYVDIETGGHHQTYLKALMDIPGKENVLVLPEKIEGLNAKQYVFRKTDFFNIMPAAPHIFRIKYSIFRFYFHIVAS